MFGCFFYIVLNRRALLISDGLPEFFDVSDLNVFEGLALPIRVGFAVFIFLILFKALNIGDL